MRAIRREVGSRFCDWRVAPGIVTTIALWRVDVKSWCICANHPSPPRRACFSTSHHLDHFFAPCPPRPTPDERRALREIWQSVGEEQEKEGTCRSLTDILQVRPVANENG
jgi:hypothetical protein